MTVESKKPAQTTAILVGKNSETAVVIILFLFSTVIAKAVDVDANK